jgi:AP-1 complex subunit beta-1
MFKVYEINPELVEDQGFVPGILLDMLSDINPMVVANAVAALSEISETKGRDILELGRENTVSKLLTALNDCTEWGQIFILDALAQ